VGVLAPQHDQGREHEHIARAVAEIVSAIITEKKCARLPFVIRNTQMTKTEPITPDMRLTVMGVPTRENLLIQDGAAPSSAAIA